MPINTLETGLCFDDGSGTFYLFNKLENTDVTVATNEGWNESSELFNPNGTAVLRPVMDGEGNFILGTQVYTDPDWGGSPSVRQNYLDFINGDQPKNHVYFEQQFDGGGAPIICNLGAELINDPDFNNPGNWTAGLGWTVAGGDAVCDGAQASDSDLTNTGVSGVAANKYQVRFDVTAYSAGNIRAFVGGVQTPDFARVGTFWGVVTAVDGSTFRLKADANFVGTVTNFSVKQIT